MNVIVKFDNYNNSYIYHLDDVNNNIATISKDGNIHMIIYTMYGWKINGVTQPHIIEFYKMGTLDECDEKYSQYKSACDKYWNLWIAPNQESEYYMDIINKLTKCINTRLEHHYTCEDDIDNIHFNAIKKIEIKIMVAMLLYESSFNNNLFEIVDEILKFDKDLIHTTWKYLFESLNVKLDIRHLNYLLNKLKY